MSEQLTFAGMEDQLAPEEKIYVLLRPVMLEALREAAVPENKLEIERQKDYYSVALCKTILVCRIMIRKKLGNLLIFHTLKPHQMDILNGVVVNTTNQEKKENFTRIKLPTEVVTEQVIELVKVIIHNSIEKLTKQYDCCSRYEACSDAGKCIHPDADFALGCGYRQILRKGVIYYGKNRNVD